VLPWYGLVAPRIDYGISRSRLSSLGFTCFGLTELWLTMGAKPPVEELFRLFETYRLAGLPLIFAIGSAVIFEVVGPLAFRAWADGAFWWMSGNCLLPLGW